MAQNRKTGAEREGAARPATARISVTLRQRYLDLLDRLAERNDLPRTTAATVLLETALERMKDGGPSLPSAHLAVDRPAALPPLTDASALGSDPAAEGVML